MSEIKGFRLPIGKKWLVNFSQSEKFTFFKIEDFTDDDIASITGFNSYKKFYRLFVDIIMDIKNKSLKECFRISKLLYLNKKNEILF